MKRKSSGKIYRKQRRKTNYISKGTGSKVINTGYGSVTKGRVHHAWRIKQDLRKETEKLVKKANSRLDSLNRRFKSGTWASKILKKNLSTTKNSFWRGGRIKLKKKMTKTQLLAVNRSARNFLSSKTSTVAGINQVREETIKTLQKTWSTKKNKMSYEDAEKFYEMFGDSNFDTMAEKVGSSALQTFVQNSVSRDDNIFDFMEGLETFDGLDMDDQDMREKAIDLYMKYVA